MTSVPGYYLSETDTAMLAASDSREFWSDHVRFNHGGLESRFDRSGKFRGETVVQRSGGFQLMEFCSDAVEYERRPVDVRRDDDRSLRVLIPRSGDFRVQCGDDRATVGPGSAVALSMSLPFVLGHDGDARAWVVSVPESSSRVSRMPRVFDLRSGIGAVASSMLVQLSVQRNNLSDFDFREVGGAFAVMLSALGSDVARWPEVATAASALVRSQSDDPALTPDMLARRLGWSLRHVQAVLATVDTTPSDLIRESRLDRAKARLEDPAERGTSITNIARASGFGSVSTFNAAFRARYGIRPSEARVLP